MLAILDETAHYTVEKLLDLAARADETLREGGNPTDAYFEREWALMCAQWMDWHKIEKATHIGPFGLVTVRQGDRVRIKPGSKIVSHHEPLNRVTTRPYTIRVSAVDRGFVHEHNRGCGVLVRNPQVVWPGSGGYWCYTEVGNVEKV